jgi:dihydroorotase
VEVRLSIPAVDDWHVHVRDGAMLRAVAPFTARWCRTAMVMPNLRPPIDSWQSARAYREEIISVTQSVNPDFSPRIAVYLSPALELEDLRAGFAAGDIAAVKFYPAGATTNSDQGMGSLQSYLPLLEEMASIGVRLLVHCESTDPEVDIFDREARFLDDELLAVRQELPDLDITVEHLSTAAGLDFVRSHPRTHGTVTPHHLRSDRNDLLASGMQPDLFCKPVLNSARDRRALLDAVCEGEPRVSFGTDSAPHSMAAKRAETIAAGVFNAPFALEVVAELLHQEGALDALGGFVARNGWAAYGMDPPPFDLELVRHDRAERPRTVDVDEHTSVVVYGVEPARHWTVSRIPQ